MRGFPPPELRAPNGDIVLKLRVRRGVAGRSAGRRRSAWEADHYGARSRSSVAQPKGRPVLATRPLAIWQ